MEAQQNEQTEPQVEQVEAQAEPQVEQAVETPETETLQAETTPVAEVPTEPVTEVTTPVAPVAAPVAVTKPAPAATEANTTLKRNARKERIGKVTSNKMQKTITIAVNRQVKDTRYGKFRNSTKKLTVHDENNDCGIGDTVRVMETRPLSKNKRWRLVEIIERAK
jgi:small subunit ribosomal protein S17